jgi:dihydroxy-acid dehydratase
VAVAEAKRTPQDILSRESFLNAITVLQAIGGSTNGVVHLLAIINRIPELQGTITLHDVDEIGRKTPLIVDLKPSGDNYMTDFHNAGGMLALLHTLRPLLHLSAKTITGQTLGELLGTSPFKSFDYSTSIIRPLTNPLAPSSSLVVLHGNLAPRGSVMKASASKDRSILSHSGPAVVFKDVADLAQRIDSPDLDVSPASVLVLQNIGPIGYPGMLEAGLIPIPRKLSREGVVDMLRISDGRMSGTAGGTIVLHVSPESALPESVLGIVRDGDVIKCNVEQRLLRLEVGDCEIARRLEERRKVLMGSAEQPAQPSVLRERKSKRGYRGLYERSVNQAHLGADFDFLTASGFE